MMILVLKFFNYLYLMKTTQFPATSIAGRPQSGTLAHEPGETGSLDPLIGKKVWTKWPEDNNFYEAVITDYNALEVSYLPSSINIYVQCFSAKSPFSDIILFFLCSTLIRGGML